MKIVTIVGARPQFIKAATVSSVVSECAGIDEILIHTGQHYDTNMSQIFFEQMGIPRPKFNLAVGSGLHGETTGKMLSGIEEILIAEKPDYVLVYGDTNSTLAGALAAAKLHIPVAHVEAGLRSFNKRMPEEINRILTDNISSLLFCPTTTALDNLANEGITQGVHNIGDVMFDATLAFGDLAEAQSTVLASLSLVSKSYCLATVHRAENTDDPKRLKSIIESFVELASPGFPLVLPLHPRTVSCIENLDLLRLLEFNSSVRVVKPVSFLDMVMLEKHAKIILTDSGGVQKEAYFHGVPCVTLRDETEWVELVHEGANVLAGADKQAILSLTQAMMGKIISTSALYGTGNSSSRIIDELLAI